MKRMRNLNKNELGGVIFGCTTSTMGECLSRQLFGLPLKHFSYVKNIEPGLPLFLFNYSQRKLYGIYKAASLGKMNIDPYAWTGDGSARTKFPAQVQICLSQQYQPLLEFQFKRIIVDNYYTQNHFCFELDHPQTTKLISEFLLQGPLQKTEVIVWAPTNKNTAEKEATQRLPLADEFSNSHDSIGTSSSLDDSLNLDGNNQLVNESPCNPIPEFGEKDLIYMKLREMALSSECPDANVAHVIGSGSSDDAVYGTCYDDPATVGRSNGGSSFGTFDSPAFVAQLSMEIEELKISNEQQTRLIENLGKKLAAAELEIQRLEKKCMVLESNASLGQTNEKMQLGLHDEFHSNLNEAILIVGGYDGTSWLSALDSFFPSHDVLRSLKPMSSARSFSSLARFNGELYVLGGGNDSQWYSTVESYNPDQNEWRTQPSLNKAKGSLASAVLNGKIFAVGGGNGVDHFSDVEMFDPYVCRWIASRSMLHKRFTLAAAKLNGALYAVGGFDGSGYLKSVERFDPREHAWTEVGSMNVARGCHSLVVMNEKLYAIGGHDGALMIPSMEIYDPRFGTWTMGEPMAVGRGYLATAVMNDCIYAMGGIDSREAIMDTIECYKDGQGWQKRSLSAVGKRSFASAIVLNGDWD